MTWLPLRSTYYYDNSTKVDSIASEIDINNNSWLSAISSCFDNSSLTELDVLLLYLFIVNIIMKFHFLFLDQINKY